MTRQDESAAYRAVMSDPEASDWLRYWLMVAWEIRPQRTALEDAQRLLDTLVMPSSDPRVRALLADGSASYWLRRSLSTALKSCTERARNETGRLVDVLTDRINSKGGK